MKTDTARAVVANTRSHVSVRGRVMGLLTLPLFHTHWDRGKGWCVGQHTRPAKPMAGAESVQELAGAFPLSCSTAKACAPRAEAKARAGPGLPGSGFGYRLSRAAGRATAQGAEPPLLAITTVAVGALSPRQSRPPQWTCGHDYTSESRTFRCPYKSCLKT